MSGAASSTATSTFASLRQQLRTRLTPLLHTLRAQSRPLLTQFQTSSKVFWQRWRVPIVVGLGVYTFGVKPDTKYMLWEELSGVCDPFLEWYGDRTQGRRKRQILQHYGVLAKGGEVIELLPGATGAFPSLDTTATKREKVSFPLLWKGIDIDPVHWNRGRLQESAGQHSGIPVSQMEFTNCSETKTSLLQLLRDTPDASVYHVLALHGLSPLFSAAPYNHALSSSAVSSDPKLQQAELQAILTEIYRVLKPGGRFIFLDEGAYGNTPSLTRFRQQLSSSISSLTCLHPRGCIQPIEIAQLLPNAGFNEAHLEQWPSQLDSNNIRKGIRTLRVIEVNGKDVLLDGIEGTHPLVAGIATKSIHAHVPTPQPTVNQFGSIFTTPN